MSASFLSFLKITLGEILKMAGLLGTCIWRQRIDTWKVEKQYLLHMLGAKVLSVEWTLETSSWGGQPLHVWAFISGVCVYITGDGDIQQWLQLRLSHPGSSQHHPEQIQQTEHIGEQTHSCTLGSTHLYAISRRYSQQFGTILFFKFCVHDGSLDTFSNFRFSSFYNVLVECCALEGTFS